jgi:hypothetical protein
VSIAAAIPTFGASVLALAPAVVSLTDTLADNAEPIARAILDNAKLPDDEVNKIKKAYEKADEKAEAALKSGKTIVNFVKMVQSMDSVKGSAADTSRLVALVKEGAQAAHELMLARNADALVAMRVAAAEAKLTRAGSVIASLQTVIDQLDASTDSIRRVALSAIDIARAKAHALHVLAFKAQRSLEIYTLKDQESRMSLDAGLIHPDASRAYKEVRLSEAHLAGLLIESWGKLLDIISLQVQYEAFFEQGLTTSTLRLSFSDVSDFPPNHFEAKIKNVLVAFVGAASQSGELSCVVRHGGEYLQRSKEGGIKTQILKARTIDEIAKFVRLDRPIDNEDDPLHAPESMALWGRGVGGDWEVFVESHEMAEESVNFANLNEVQVWIDYQFIR